MRRRSSKACRGLASETGSRRTAERAIDWGDQVYVTWEVNAGIVLDN